MIYLVDTNVPKVANGPLQAPQASPHCVLTCIRYLKGFRKFYRLILDDDRHIIREYMQQLRSEGQPGVGDAFLKWVLTNEFNPLRCERVRITPIIVGQTLEGFAEFPDDPALTGFDPSDHKFVAVALAHSDQPPILNAVDSDWSLYREALVRHGIQVEELCPESLKTSGMN